MFKKLGKKVIADTKEVVAEEAKKTGKDVKSFLKPILISFAVGVALGFIIRGASTKVIIVR